MGIKKTKKLEPLKAFNCSVAAYIIIVFCTHGTAGGLLKNFWLYNLVQPFIPISFILISEYYFDVQLLK